MITVMVNEPSLSTDRSFILLPDEFFGTPMFEVMEPAEVRVPFLFNSPHSGRLYPSAFIAQSILRPDQIRLSEDAFVDLIFHDVVAMGAAFMRVNFPRAFLDVNRGPYELDQAFFMDALPDFVPPPSLRAKAGLGTVPSVVAVNTKLYEKPLLFSDARERIEQFYFPYHKALEAELCRIEKQFGYAVLIDCHSMPGNLKYFEGKQQPDIILGDCHGRSCAPELLEYLTELFREKGYFVAHNQPYSGGYITNHYGAPMQNRHVLQIEINRDLYLNEHLMEPHSGFLKLHTDIMAVCADLVSLPEVYLLAGQNAAE